MVDKDKTVTFLLGVIVGIFMTFVFLGGVYAVYKVGKRVFSYEGRGRRVNESREVRVRTRGNPDDFKINFEKKEDLEFFELKDGVYIEQSKAYVTDGKYSLLAEYPKGATYPGLFWEVYRKDRCLDASNAYYFSFDVYNNSEVDVVLSVKLKSGPKYPKKVYQKQINLPAQQSTSVKIPIVELRGYLNVKEISYINLFINKPQENIILYFDNLHLERRQGAKFNLGVAWAQTKSGAEASFKLAVVDSLHKVFKFKRKIPLYNAAKLHSAKNEYESFQILIYDVKKDLSNIKVAVSDLLSLGGDSKIPSSFIKVKTVGYVPTRKPYYKTSYVGLWPDPLIEKDKFVVQKNDTYVLWVTVYIPADIPAGEYKGFVEIQPENDSSSGIPLNIYVWDFKLPKESHLKTAFDFYEHFIPKFYTRTKDESYEDWKERIRNIIEDYYASMLEYRISPILNLDPLSNDFDQRIEKYLDYGITVFGIGRYGGSFGNNWPKNKDSYLISLYRKYAQVLRAKNILEKTYLYTWDEGKIGNPRVKEITEIIHEADPELKNMVAYHGFWDPDKNPEWGKGIDIWSFQIANYNGGLKKKLEGLGKEIWMYVSGPDNVHPNFAIDFPAIDARILPWMSWKYNIKGLLYWSVNFTRVNPYESAMNTDWYQNGNGLLYYPGENGPVASLRLELIRDGIEDYEYLYLLQKRMEKLMGKGLDIKHQNLVMEGEELLDIDDSIVGSFSKYTKDPQRLYDLRRRIAEQIVKIDKILNGEGG